MRTSERFLSQPEADEAVIFADAVHPTHAVRPVGCWAPKELAVAVEQSSGRNRLNIHGAIDLETGQTIMKDVPYCPRLNPIERLWGLMHRHTTHNKCYASFRDSSTAMLNFLRHDVPENWGNWSDQVSDNFRIINPTKYRILT